MYDYLVEHMDYVAEEVIVIVWIYEAGTRLHKGNETMKDRDARGCERVRLA